MHYFVYDAHVGWMLVLVPRRLERNEGFHLLKFNNEIVLGCKEKV